MREIALTLAVDWHKRHFSPSATYSPEKVVDTAKVFLLFLDGEDTDKDSSTKRKNPVTKGQPRS